MRADDYLKAVLSSVSPMEAACEFGLNPAIQDNTCVIECPNCSHTMWVLKDGFVCGSHACSFKAGSALDLMALIERIRIPEALNLFLSRFSDQTNKITKISSPDIQYEVALRAQQRRRLLEFFLRRRNKTENKIPFMQTEGALKKMGINISCQRLSAFILGEKDMEELHAILKGMGKTAPDPLFNTATLVIPYMSNHHSIDSLTFAVPTRPGKPPKIVNISKNAKISWAGLLQVHPAVQEIELVESCVDMMRVNTNNVRLGQVDNIALHCRYHGNIADTGWMPSKTVFMLTGYQTSMEILLYLSKLGSSFPSMDLIHDNQRLCIRSFILDKCYDQIFRDGMNSETKLILEAVRITEEESKKLVDRLHNDRKFSQADELRNFFRVTMVHRDEKLALYASPEGYSMTKNDNLEKTPVTNFTISLTENLVFSDNQDIFHIGTVNSGGVTVPIALRPTDLDRIQDLESTIRIQTSQSLLSQDKLPTVRDRNAARIMSSYLRHKVSEIPFVEGIPFLGWNKARTRYYGPYWVADALNGCQIIKGKLHPFSEELKNFSTVSFEHRIFESDIPVEVSRVIAQFVSVMVRSYLNLPTQSVLFKNDSYTRTNFARIFECLGQRSYRRYAATRDGIKQSQPVFVGFMAYGCVENSFMRAQGQAGNVSNNTHIPGFYLVDEADPLVNTAYSDEVIGKCQRTFVHIIFEVLNWIFKTGAKSFETAKSISPQQTYTLEGTRIISEVCGVKNWLEKKSNFGTLEAFLASITYDEVNRFVEHDINSHIVTLNLSSVPDADREAIAAEVHELSSDAVYEEHKITANADVMMAALEQFYGATPLVNEHFDAEELLSSRMDS
jgi:hypothetical protein